MANSSLPGAAQSAPAVGFQRGEYTASANLRIFVESAAGVVFQPLRAGPLPEERAGTALRIVKALLQNLTLGRITGVSTHSMAR
jgi:hypothetical protein